MLALTRAQVNALYARGRPGLRETAIEIDSPAVREQAYPSVLADLPRTGHGSQATPVRNDGSGALEEFPAPFSSQPSRPRANCPGLAGNEAAEYLDAINARRMFL